MLYNWSQQQYGNQQGYYYQPYQVQSGVQVLSNPTGLYGYPGGQGQQQFYPMKQQEIQQYQPYQIQDQNVGYMPQQQYQYQSYNQQVYGSGQNNSSQFVNNQFIIVPYSQNGQQQKVVDYQPQQGYYYQSNQNYQVKQHQVSNSETSNDCYQQKIWQKFLAMQKSQNSESQTQKIIQNPLKNETHSIQPKFSVCKIDSIHESQSQTVPNQQNNKSLIKILDENEQELKAKQKAEVNGSGRSSWVNQNGKKSQFHPESLQRRNDKLISKKKQVPRPGVQEIEIDLSNSGKQQGHDKRGRQSKLNKKQQKYHIGKIYHVTRNIPKCYFRGILNYIRHHENLITQMLGCRIRYQKLILSFSKNKNSIFSIADLKKVLLAKAETPESEQAQKIIRIFSYKFFREEVSSYLQCNKRLKTIHLHLINRKLVELGLIDYSYFSSKNLVM